MMATSAGDNGAVEAEAVGADTRCEISQAGYSDKCASSRNAMGSLNRPAFA